MRLRMTGIFCVGVFAAGCLSSSSNSVLEGGSSNQSVSIREHPQRGAVRGSQTELVLDVLDEYMDALNDLDMERHVGTYHFPHYRHASGKIVIWDSPREAMPILDVPVAQRREAIRGALEPDWDRSEWTVREIVQAGPGKVHVTTQFVRLRYDGSVIKTFDSLYVLTLENGRWGIRGRSSFAP